MYSSGVQVPAGRGPRGAATRRRLLDAATALIAEVGWGRVSTRAIAGRAGVPLGAVSYHFASKQALLVEAAVSTVERALPRSALESVQTWDDLVRLATGWLAGRGAVDRVTTPVLLEAMQESTRDAVLRERIATALRDYRRLVADLVRTERRESLHGVTPSAVATLFVAACDGLWLHALLDPQLEVGAASEALRCLLPAERES